MGLDSFSDDLMNDFELNDVIELVKRKSVEEMCEMYNDGGESIVAKTNDTGASIEGTLGENQNNNTFLDLLRKSYVSREEFQDSVKKIALEQGYAFVIKRSKPAYYVIMGCDRGGTYRAITTADKRKRCTSTRLINYPFEIWAKRKGSTWVLEIKNLSHNHEPSTDMSGHPMCRRFSEEDLQIVRTLSKAGSAPREILSTLRQKNPNLQANAISMYNARAKIKKDNLWGRTMIEALFEELGECGFIYDIECDDNG